MKYMRETEEYITVEFTSNSGNKYEVGYLKTAGYTKENIESDCLKKENNTALTDSDYKYLHWVADGESTTSDEAHDVGIERDGKVTIINGNVYTYRINFANYKGWGFTFRDETHDTYWCPTPHNGSHYVDYNSSKSTVNGVK